MLELKQIVKNYYVGDTTVPALKGIDLKFRKNEFVSILGQSGCGKTTLLNIIGGLDKYTSGDLIINGKSTKQFKDKDWDSYRNHSIGFIFQSYNLIPHQSVLANVELALTLAGISKKERLQRAKDALIQVGLEEHMYKKPNQMSGGQMQRVAIARALVNNPDIILADEPTGALDSKTSVQIMEILKEIAKDKLIIMVTHNPDLAKEYSTRVIQLLDGQVIEDSNPLDKLDIKQDESKVKHISMSFKTALSLSLNNLMTKKGRTFLTAFAGSIGIIGIALILSLSNGVQEYINKVEEDTLSSYPITVQKESVDISSMLSSMVTTSEQSKDLSDDKVHSMNVMSNMISNMLEELNSNDLKSFKSYIETTDIKDYTSDIKYHYTTQMNIYKADTSNGVYQVNPSKVFEDMGMTQMGAQGPMMMSNMDVWTELLGNEELLSKQYDIIAGHMPENYDEVVLIIDDNNQVTDYTLYSLGLLDTKELKDYLTAYINGEEATLDTSVHSYEYDEILDLRYKLLLNSDYYTKVNDQYIDMSDDEIYLSNKLKDAIEIKVVGIIQPNEDTTISTTGVIGYTSDLMEHLITKVNESEIVQAQLENKDVDVFTNIPFKTDEESSMTYEQLMMFISQLPQEQQVQYMTQIEQAKAAGMSENKIAELFAQSMNQTTQATYEENLSKLGVSFLDDPNGISFYPKDFESKDKITNLIDEYNTKMQDEGKEDLVIQYTDIMGVLLSSVTTIINSISYILVAFVAISLVVSSIMIGIITYISVLERTKEIGILRSIGASKKDISRVFNAETFIVGSTAGAIGILVTILLSFPINMICENITGIANICKLPPIAGVILVAISMILTVISGLIPSKVAANKDPVTALRTE